MKKSVLIGVCGGIAAYKVYDLCSKLVRNDIDVHVMMTKEAMNFVSPLTFANLTHNAVNTDLFDINNPMEIRHISLSKNAECVCIVPATANIIGKIANGIADDFLTTTVIASEAPVLLVPAMNTNMLNNKATQSNIARLKSYGYEFVESESGMLACGVSGNGRLAKVDKIFQAIMSTITKNRDLEGKTFLVTAGATSEPIDEVRYITNKSSGKMGISIADEAYYRGAKVVLVAGKTSIDIKGVPYQNNLVNTTIEMFEMIKNNISKVDYIIMAGAPSDYRVEKIQTKKIKDQEINLKLIKNPDISKWVGENKGNKKLCIFAAETENLIENAKNKLSSKNADMVVANDVTVKGAGFDVDTNVVTIIDKTTATSLPIMSKREVAKVILDKIMSL